MILARIGPPGQERPVVIQNGRALDVSGIVNDFDAEFWTGGGPKNLALTEDLATVDLDGVRIGPPVPQPSKLVCIGLNYEDHVREAGAERPEEPVVFMKAPNTVIGPDDDVVIPPGAEKTDYEVELAVVIGDRARYLPDTEAAQSVIAGYAISNDVSERHYQLERGGQWAKGKSFETFNPLGPYVVTRDELDHLDSLDLTLSVNGEVRQHSNTSQMIFSLPHIVWYLSQHMVLEPGDIINTGTPPGVGLGMNPPRYLQPGDVVEASITGLGVQRQTVREATR